jgi:hypothetical protein
MGEGGLYLHVVDWHESGEGWEALCDMNNRLAWECWIPGCIGRDLGDNDWQNWEDLFETYAVDAACCLRAGVNHTTGSEGDVLGFSKNDRLAATGQSIIPGNDDPIKL